MQSNKTDTRIIELLNEIQELKNRNELQRKNYEKKIDYAEEEIKKIKIDEGKYMKDLEIKNKSNEEIISQLKARIKEIEKIKNDKKNINGDMAKGNKSKVIIEKKTDKIPQKSNSLSEKLSISYKSPLMQSPTSKNVKILLPKTRSNSNIKESLSSNDLIQKKSATRDSSAERSSNLPIKKLTYKTPSYLKKTNQSSHIEIIEKEIAGLTSRYKYLLQMSQDASDLLSLRTEINKIVVEIEEKSSQLFALQKHQEEYLKQQMKH